MRRTKEKNESVALGLVKSILDFHLEVMHKHKDQLIKHRFIRNLYNVKKEAASIIYIM